MNIAILGEDNKFMNELRELIENQISCLSVQMFFDNNDFFGKAKLSDVNVCLTVINNRKFKDCFQMADTLIGENPSVKIAFLYDYMIAGWLEKVNGRKIQLVSKESMDMIGDIKKVISGKELTYEAEKFLTTREAEILRLVSQGDTQDEIAEELKIGVRTVRTHVANIYDKLGVSSQGAAVRRGIELGIIPINYEISEEF